MKRKPIALVLITALLSMATVPTAVASDGESSPLVTGPGNRGSDVVQGSVTGYGANATVELQLFPKDELTRNLDSGTSLQLLTVSATRLDSGGGFVLKIDRGSIPSDYIADDGQIDGRVLATDDQRVAGSWTFSAKLTKGGAVLDAESGRSASIPDIRVDLGAGQRIAPAARACGGFHYSNPHGPYQTKIADAFAKGNVTGRVTYAYGGSTSTTLGVASQVAGSWSASGSMTKSASSSVGFSAASLKDKRIHTLWQYRDVIYGCGGKDSQPYAYVGRGQTLSVTHPNYTYCGGTYSAGDEFFTQSATNQSFSSGLTVYGVGLSSKAGWSANMELHFNFTTAGNVCGSNSLREAAPRVEASTP